jgi:bifunctional UDP-N-acetylglucosamine pyrophosphorylase/glucosamine-1-phosphate N-acetyltransferase
VSPTLAAAVVLAAGEGTRMKSAIPKVLHTLGGRPLLAHAVAAVEACGPEHLCVVVGHGRDQVVAELAAFAPRAVAAVQHEQLGTGHAVECGLQELPELSGAVLVTYGDVPLLAPETLQGMLTEHEAAGAAVTVLTAVVEDPTGYGRIVRDESGAVAAIVEQRDTTAEQAAITEINSGIYAFDAAVLAAALARLETDNDQGELYLTDVLAIARSDGHLVQARAIEDTWQTEGVNDRIQLAELEAEMRRRTNEAWMLAGVTMRDPSTTWIDADVALEPDVVLEPGVSLRGATTVAAGATIGPDTTLVDTAVGAGATVVRSHAVSARIGERALVGPFTYLRPDADLRTGSKAGAFVEIKSSVVGPGSKVPHLSYVGDALIGEQTNIGAATVVVNYDGIAKHRTIVGDHVRVGSDSMLVAPVTIGDGAYTAAGSVITEDVPPGAMAVARGRQRTIEGWTRRRRPGTAAAAAADAAHAADADEDAGQSPGDRQEGDSAR